MRKRWVVIGLLLGGLAGTLQYVSLPGPTGPDEGVGLCGGENSAPPPRATLRIGTFNIHGGKGLDGRRDLDRTAACLASLDFVALQEVHGPALWQTANQAQTLGARLGMAWLFAPSARTWLCLDAGNGCLSNLPVGGWQRIPLVRREDRTYRNAVLLELQHFGRTIHVVATHLNKTCLPERAAHLREAIGLFLAVREPAILLGDLNTPADDPQLAALLATPGVIDAVRQAPPHPTATADDLQRIDWILVRGLRVVDAGLIDRGASDHPLVWAELDCPKAAHDVPRLAGGGN